MFAAVIVLLLVAAAAGPAHASDDGEGTTLFVRTQSLYPPYIDYEMSNRWWDFGGATVVNTNRYIRLTPDLQGRRGWLRAKLPFIADAWSVEFEYKIHGKSSSMAGDGFAFYFTREMTDKTGAVLGGPEKWHGLALVFDTYDNGRHGYTYPYVAALHNDGTQTYNKDTDGKEIELGGCEADIRNKDYATRARVRYIKGKYLRVELNTRGWDDWTTCISVDNVTLPNPGYYSFYGETGGLSDNHDIISVSTNQIVKDDNSHVNPDQRNHWNSSFMVPDASGPPYLLIFFFLLAIAGVAYFALQAVNGPSRGGGKRDYKHF
ncbi:hypothetical protein H9P43_002799 [Blastocladiella emersonii ATCC 22665]|nr:hypothetical protein H9P43_002799 [Blastocladiella emersonii ATCC 22665]